MELVKRPLLLLFLIGPASAWATAEFPSAIQSQLGLGDLPSELCGLCHTNGNGQSGTVNTPFGRSMRMRGLLPNDRASLDAALAALATENVDSDGDGVSDVTELMAATSPNVVNAPTGGGSGGTGGGSVVIEPVRFGCGAAVVPELLFFVALRPLLRSRRRQRC